MLIIVIGCGKVGSNFATAMLKEGHEVVIIDSDVSAFSILGPNFTGITITGIPIDEDILKQAGIESADALAALTPDDNINIMVSQVAKEIFKVPKVLARIFNPAREQVFHQFGLETICPTNINVEVIRSIILGENRISRHSIGSNLFSYRYETIGKSKAGKKISSLQNFYKDCHIFGIKRGNDIIFVKGETIIRNGDILVLVNKVD